MSDEPDTFEHALQEYLDGRLSPAERAAFEARLEREPELRLELASALELRAALGADGPEPSPGFYTRARARFEESARGKKRWSFRLLSWETAGLAAAAALATALFVPRLMQQGVPADLGAVAEGQEQTAALDEARDRDTPARPEPADERMLAETTKAQASEMEAAPLPASPVQKAKREKKGRETANLAEPSVREPLGFTDAEDDLKEGDATAAGVEAAGAGEARVQRSAARQETPGPPPRRTPAPRDKGPGKDVPRSGREEPVQGSTAGLDAGTMRRERIERDDDAFHTAAPAAESERAAASDAAYESAAAAPAELEEEVAQAELWKRAVAEPEERQPVVVELPAGLVTPEALRSVERLEEWLALAAGPAGEALEMLGTPTPERRLILIGAREGLACDSLMVVRTGDAWRIEVAFAPQAREAGSGCALVLPHDGRAISVAGPR